MRSRQAVTALIRHEDRNDRTRHIRAAPGPTGGLDLLGNCPVDSFRSRRAEPRGLGRYAQYKGSARTSGWARRHVCMAGRSIQMRRLCRVRRCRSALPVGEGLDRLGNGPGDHFRFKRAEPRRGCASAQRKPLVTLKALAGVAHNSRAAPGPRDGRSNGSVWRGLAFNGDDGAGCGVAKAPSTWGRSGRCPTMPGGALVSFRHTFAKKLLAD